MTDKQKLLVLTIVSVGLIAVFMTIHAYGNWDYVLPRRAKKIAAILLTGVAISLSTVVFQTLTNNKILTPSLIGLDSLYLLLQTGIVFVFGSTALTTMSKNVHFLLSAAIMVPFAALLYKLMFLRKDGRAIYFLLLVGIICGSFFSSIATFLQLLLDPNEFLVVQDKMFASFNNVNGQVLISAAALVLCSVAYFRRDLRYLDVLALGRDHAVNLGVAHDRITKRLLIFTALLVAVSTSLVGPITFLGFLVANVAYRLMSSFRAVFVLPAAVLLSFAALVGGQLVVERLFTFSTSLSVILNFAGGLYFLYLLLKEERT